MDEEQNQQRQRSSPLDTYLNYRSGLRNLRFLIKGARAVGPLISILTNPVSLGLIAVVVVTFVMVFYFTPGGPANIELPLQPTNGTTAPVPPAPDNTSEFRQRILNQFGIDFKSEFFKTQRGNQLLEWSWEVLWQANYYAPKFFDLLGRNAEIDTHNAISERFGNTIKFSTKPGSFFVSGTKNQFKVLLIHELSHIIRGNGRFDDLLNEAVENDGGFLTGYGENPCTGTTAIDEDFSETVTYYINKGIPEQDLGCGKKSTDGKNPLESGRYPNHFNFIKSVLNP